MLSIISIEAIHLKKSEVQKNFFDFQGIDINMNPIEYMGDIAGEKATLIVNVAST